MRRRRAVKRKINPDPKYRNLLLAKFINMLMWKGKKQKAENIVYRSLDIVQEKTNTKDPLDIFVKAIDNIRPLLEVKPRRVGGATYQVPVEVSSERGRYLALRWIRDLARQSKGQPMYKKLAKEIIDASNKTGGAMKKRDDTHKMAESNKAFSHYRW